MVEFKKVLFPVDLSAISTRVAEHALTVARTFAAELHVIYVVRAFEAFGEIDYIPSTHFEASLADLNEAAGARLRQFVEKNLSDYPVIKWTVLNGHTAREILKYVDENDISLVVMGTHGRRGFDKILFGSVAQRVVQSCLVPVMTIRPVAASK
jgi:nucleotide-binding universal stress UspA family protein